MAAIKNVILIEKDKDKKVYGSLTETCKINGFPYNKLARLKFPFEHEGWKFFKIGFRIESEIDNN